jgi:hypothetical protein
MEVENKDMQHNHGPMNCSKYPQYCSNGKKKSDKELQAMRKKSSAKDNTLDLVTGLHPNSCTADTCSYDDYYLNGQHQSPRSPDHYNLTVGFSIPGLGAIVSLAPTITLDRFGNAYGGLGVSFGPESPVGISPSLVGGWASDGPPTEKRSEDFLSGVFVNVSGGVVVGGGWNWNPINGGHSWDGGAYWPQLSGTVGVTGNLHDAHRQEPLWGP